MLSDLVCDDDDSVAVRSDIIDKNVSFGVSQLPVDVSHVHG